MNLSLSSQIDLMPESYGVYMMKDASNKIIYVGKAKNIRKRVKSYFRNSTQNENHKIQLLVNKIHDIDYLVTENESEALILEANLIREKKPIYNIRLKDDKSFPYLKINIQDDWPRVSITRNLQNDGSRYFGPFTSPGSARKNLETINKIFPWRSCTKKITGKDDRPCLDYFIKRCIAPCTSYCTKDEYNEVIQQTILFLEGKTEHVNKQLNEEMGIASKNLDYEKAARLRDQINAIKKLENYSSTVSSITNLNADAIGLINDQGSVVYNVLHFRGRRLISNDSNQASNDLVQSDQEVLSHFLLQYYSVKNLPPRYILTNILPKQKKLIEHRLTQLVNKKVSIVKPSRGFKKRLVQLAIENANEYLLKNISSNLSATNNIDQGLKIIADELELIEEPSRIECYDISHIQGTDIVGSMVVFENGKPNIKKYRRFKLQSMNSQDDYFAIKEIFTRRLKRMQNKTSKEKNDWHSKPNLVVIDGGKGQLNAALEALLQTGIKDITICGLAKKNEEIYVADVSEPIRLQPGTPGITLLQRIRDEAHRFAISYHRSLRSKRQIKSLLDDIEGIGQIKKQLLIDQFGSIEKIKKASKEELARINGIGNILASKIKRSI
tara:strand:- start:4143 stop:5975 length:1833 start_codon:yes stop_codon:yes gene_type:complete